VVEFRKLLTDQQKRSTDTNALDTNIDGAPANMNKAGGAHSNLNIPKLGNASNKSKSSRRDAAQRLPAQTASEQEFAGKSKTEAAWTEVVGRKRNPVTAVEATRQSQKKVIRLPRPKAPAVLVKVASGSSYEDTVRSVRSSGIDPDSIGASVTAMRKTRAGDLLIEFRATPSTPPRH